MHNILFILAVLLSVPSYAQQCIRGDKDFLLSLPSLQYVSLDEMRASFFHAAPHWESIQPLDRELNSKKKSCEKLIGWPLGTVMFVSTPSTSLPSGNKHINADWFFHLRTEEEPYDFCVSKSDASLMKEDTKRLVSEQTKSDTAKIPAVWLNGKFCFITNPLPYFGFVVSNEFGCFEVLKGQRQHQAFETYKSAYFTKANEYALFKNNVSFVFDGGIYWDIKRLFAQSCVMSEELNAKGQHYKLSSDTTDYNLIAYVSSTGNISIDILTPETLSDSNKKDVALLTDYFTHLPKWTLTPLYVSDGRILSGRYYHIQKKGTTWRIMDYLEAAVRKRIRIEL